MVSASADEGKRPLKAPKDSYTEQVQIVMQQHVNGAGRLFGGQLMQWIDVTAGVAARRHSQLEVTTAAVGSLQFLAAAHVNDIIVLAARVTWTGRTSMEVRVDTFVEARSGVRTPINCAYLILVALDENERPALVPELQPETEEDRAEWEAAALRRQGRPACAKAMG